MQSLIQLLLIILIVITGFIYSVAEKCIINPSPQNVYNTIEKIDSLPLTQIEIFSSDAIIYECGSNEALVTILRTSGNISQSLEIQIEISGNAVNGIDYNKISDVYTIPAFQTEVSFIIHAFKDGLFEGDETVILTIIPSQAYNIVNGEIEITISDFQFVVSNNNSNKVDKQINLFPNPAKKFLNIKQVENDVENITFYTLSGKIVQTYTPEENRIYIAGLKIGVYLVEVKTNKGAKLFKIIKTKN